MPRFFRDLPGRVFQWVDRAGSAPQARAERGQRRVQQVVFLIGLYIVIAYGAAVMAVVYVDDVRKYAEGNVMARTRIETRRGDILDRNGVTLATSLRSDAVSTNPRWLLPPGVKPEKMPFGSPEGKAFREKIARRVAQLTGTDPADVIERAQRDVGFVYLAKNLDDKAARAVRAAQLKGELPGITLEPEFVRYYPNNQLAGALVGRPTQTGSVEASFDNLLRGQQVELRTYKDSSATPLYFDGAPEPGVYGGRSLVLTIDEKIQAVAEHHLDAATEEFMADFGIALVMDVHTGEVLAMAVSPGVNPNDSKNKPKYGWHNIAVENQYEPGSTFKVFNLAIGLAEKAVRLDEVIATGGGIVVGNKLIKDDHPHGQVTGLQSLQVSSNIANAKIAMRMERETYYQYLLKLGFGRRLDLGMIGESSGQLAPPARWSKVQYANIAFGQGIAVTPLQMVAAFSAVANGGTWRRPRLVRDELSPDGKSDRLFEVEPGVKVFDEQVSRQVLEAMASVCQPRRLQANGQWSLGGTGTKARLPNYTIGGKTGTAQQAENGAYSDTHWVGSFIGVTPIEKPRLAILVAIDTPKKFDPALGKIARYGGIVAAPVVREIARFALPYLGVPASPGAPYLDRDDPDKARQQDLQRKQLAAKAVDQAGKTVAEAGAAAAPGSGPGAGADAGAGNLASALTAEQARVPDLRGVPMRAARQKLAEAGLEIAAKGSGVAVQQDLGAGTVVAKGSLVQVTFRRLTEVADTPRPLAAKPSTVVPPGGPAPHDALPKAAVPTAKPGVPAAKAGVPAPKAGVPAPKAGVPAAKAGVPAAKAGVPAAKALGPASKPAPPAAPKAGQPAPAGKQEG